MSIKTWTGTALILATLSLTGCGGGANTPQLSSVPVDAATESAAESAATATAAERSVRGSLVKEIGEPGGIAMQEGSDEWALNFTVTGIEVDPVCTQPDAVPAENGHLLAISIEASTGPEPGFSEVLYNGFSFNSHAWKVIASNGTTVNTNTSAATYGCFSPAEMLPASLGPAEKVTGKVLLDVPDASGTLVLSYYGSNGWEWEYSAK